MLLGDNRRAMAAGLTFGPVSEPIRATLWWDLHEKRGRVDLPIRGTRIAPVRKAEVVLSHSERRAQGRSLFPEAQQQSQVFHATPSMQQRIHTH